MDDRLKITLDKIIRLTQQNSEFNTELRKRLEMTPSAIAVSNYDTSIKDDVYAIREALEIRANKSISYNFIKEQHIKDQLIIDNLRMENAALNLQDDENERFYLFCVNAFYQIENIVNYYFYCRYPEINELLTCIENATKTEPEKYQFHRNEIYKNVSDIPISFKLNAICNILSLGKRIKITCSQLRQVRNEGSHRCIVIMKDQNEESSLYKFFQYNNFNSIRIVLIKLVNKIETGLTAKIDEKDASVTITSILPGACFIRYNNKNISLPDKFLSIVRDLKQNDIVIITLKGDEIIKVTLPHNDENS